SGAGTCAKAPPGPQAAACQGRGDLRENPPRPAARPDRQPPLLRGAGSCARPRNGPQVTTTASARSPGARGTAQTPPRPAAARRRLTPACPPTPPYNGLRPPP